MLELVDIHDGVAAASHVPAGWARTAAAPAPTPTRHTGSNTNRCGVGHYWGLQLRGIATSRHRRGEPLTASMTLTGNRGLIGRRRMPW